MDFIKSITSITKAYKGRKHTTQKMGLDREAFAKEITEQLEPLQTKKRAEFALRCALRALPLIVATEPKELWFNALKKRSLQDLFTAFDISLVVTYGDSSYRDLHTSQVDTTPTKNDDETTSLAAYSANSAFEKAKIATFEVRNYGAARVARAADTVVKAAETAKAASGYREADAAHATKAATNAAIAVYDAAQAAGAPMIISSLLEDLKKINQREKFTFNTNPYNDYWNQFETTLRDFGCSYWLVYFCSIYQHGFYPNLEKAKIHTAVDDSIRNQGPAAVANYLVELEKSGAKRLNEARLIVLGDKGAGKTSVVRRLQNSNAAMPEPEESTAGVDTHLWKRNDCNIRLWDFAGHTVTHAAHKFFLSERCIYLIVYNGRNENTKRLKHWLSQIRNYGGDSSVIILVNKFDDNTEKLPENILREKYNISFISYINIKKETHKISTFREQILRELMGRPSWQEDIVPESYYLVKNELEELFKSGNGENTDLIQRQRFDSIAKNHNIEDASELLKNLHALGISLWYEEIEEINTLVLNPEWITQGVYQIINWATRNNQFQVSIDDFSTIFSRHPERYPECQHTFLYKLFLHYELAYELEAGNTLVIPHLLNEDQPRELPEFKLGEALLLRYTCEPSLPLDVITRFIVRHNTLIRKPGEVWKFGVILKSDNSDATALVREDERRLEVSVKGAGRKAFITELRASLNDIFSAYKTEKPQIEYKIFCEDYGYSSDASKEGFWLSEKKVCAHAEDDVPYFEEASHQKIDLKPVADQYNISFGHGTQFYIGPYQNIQFSYQECKVRLQDALSGLAQDLADCESDEHAKKLKATSEKLSNIKNLSDETKNDPLTKSSFSSVAKVVNELSDEKSSLNKTIKSVKRGKEIAQQIAEQYNHIAPWLGLPKVPKPFLKP